MLPLCEFSLRAASSQGNIISPEAEFLDETQTKDLRVFLLAIHSHLYSFALRFLFLQTHSTSYNFYSSVTSVQYIENHTPFPMV